MKLRLDARADAIAPRGQKLHAKNPDSSADVIDYDELIVGTGAVPVQPPIEGLAELTPGRWCTSAALGGRTFALTDWLDRIHPGKIADVDADKVFVTTYEGEEGIAIETMAAFERNPLWKVDRPEGHRG